MNNTKLLRAADLAKLLSVSRRTIYNLVEREGLPHRADGKELLFDDREAVAWYIERERRAAKPATFAEAERRKMEADAGLKELKLQSELGKVVLIADVAAAQSQVASNIRTRMLSLPAKMAQRLVGRDRTQIRVILDKEIRDVLAELAQTAGKISLPDPAQ